MQYLMMFNEDTLDAKEPSLPAKIRNGEVLFAIAELNELRAFQEYEGMFGKAATFVGFPTPDGQSGPFFSNFPALKRTLNEKAEDVAGNIQNRVQLYVNENGRQ